MLVSVGFAITSVLGLGREPGCGSAGDGDGALNAPCTRAKDCGDGLTCSEGVCSSPDAGAKDATAAVVDASTD